ncbi:MAG: S1 RNA-binding domain-containing protein [Anaerolineaceae bacterium]|nr:S1 RNA-binding domain-containing protein [Anaerolineaceae bacterium]
MESSVAAEEDRTIETNETNDVKPKMHFTGTVVKTGLAGAIIDIGIGRPAVIHISQIITESVEPIKRVEDVLKVGQQVDVWVKKTKDNRVELTMIKPLDLEWRDIKKGMNVKGQVVRLEKFGAFIEIGAERPGLIHISEMAHGYVRQPSDVVNEGDEIEAQVIDVNRKKKQIKLSLKALQPEPIKEEELPRVFTEPIRKDKDKDKPARRKKVKSPRIRGESGSSDVDELLATINEPEKEAEPTAMEMAMREAMDRAKARKQEDKARKTKGVSQAQQDILNRTLENKVQS